MRTRNSTVEKELARIAVRQHGLVTRQQLLAAGISASGIRRRIEKGTLILVYRGVYRVGHRAPSTEADYLAAVLACGSGSVLSGSAAAHLYGLVKGDPPFPHVTTPTWRRIDGITTRRSKSIDVATLRCIPITPAPRVLVELAADLDDEELARACHEAGVRYRTTPRQVGVVLARFPKSPGASRLRAIMSGDTRVTLSKLERRFLEVLKAAGLPLPITNRVANGRRVDCRWPEYRLTVELLSYTYHGSRYAWERDFARQREAYERKDEFRAYTYRDVFEDPTRMLRELRGLLVPKSAA